MGSDVINNSVLREDASTLSGDTSSVFAAASIHCSHRNVPCGDPAPRMAVFAGRFVLHM